MVVEILIIEGQDDPQTVVPIVGDGACLFRTLSFLIHGSQEMHNDVRMEIVRHVVANWNEFSIMSCDENGDNYATLTDYNNNMLKTTTFGSLCELEAAGQIFPFVFEIYRNGTLYAKTGIDGRPVKRLRFTGSLSNGHFDAYVSEKVSVSRVQNTGFEKVVTAKKITTRREEIPITPSPESWSLSLFSSYESLELITRSPIQKSIKKRRARYTNKTRKIQKQQSSENNPTAHQKAVAKYQKSYPEVHQQAVEKYQRTHPEVHRQAVANYQATHIEEHRYVQSQYRNNTSQKIWKNKALSGFTYESEIIYDSDKSVNLGIMNIKCQLCSAFKWKDETAGMCCSGGKVFIKPFESLPEPLYSLIMDVHPDHEHFLTHIRQYNSCFQMTSFGAKPIFHDGFMPTFKVQGQVYHLIGSLLPMVQQEARFLQIYFVGEDEQEANMRCSNFPTVKPHLVKALQKMLHDVNPYIKDLKTTIEKLPPSCESFKIVIHAEKKPIEGHAGRYNTPTANEVALVMVGQQFEKRDIILENKSSTLHRISEIHRSYDALQYPLLFCRGEDGYSINVLQHDPITKIPLKKTVSAASFYAYRIMIREGVANHLIRFRSLFSQFLVDEYAKIETERLSYIRHNQSKLRAENYIHLKDAVGREDTDPNNLGQMIVLPSSFTGGSRYMHERTQDAMTYVRHFGRPDLFITFTCNPRWEDITKYLFPGQKSHDRHDLIARVFHLKVKKMMDLLCKGKLFGEVRCFMYSIEWQKRGLPHVHILLWLINKITPDILDKIITAEIPNVENDPKLYNIVKSNMVHGPCGSYNHKSPCMKDKKCTKRFPKPLISETQTGDDGYPTYRRRSPADGGYTVNVRGEKLDNQWIVPYNPVLLRTFNAHINVEYCNSVKSIKYVCKYVNKGSDQATFALDNLKDEVKIYENGRYISSSEAVWRILGFPIHEHFPTVVHLAVHLENGQRIYFNEQNLADRVANPPTTTLLAFFKLCQIDNFAKTLKYSDVPAYYVWNKNTKFERRKRGVNVDGWPGVKKEHALGRVYTVHPNNTECYHLRMLLHEVRGPTSFEALKTINGVVHPTFQSACKTLGLLEDDQHWYVTLEEAALCNSPNRIRELFTIMLVFCQISDPLGLWEKFKDCLSEDFKRQIEREMDGDIAEGVVYNKCLYVIEEAVLALGGRTFQEYGLPQPNRPRDLRNIVYLRETNYNIQDLGRFVTFNESTLNTEQRLTYNKIISSVETNAGGIFFLDAPGGTGKTYLLNLILARIRSTYGIALAVASSGIAATLLDGGRTAHATFKLPLDLTHTETPVCSISKQSNLAEVLKSMKIIVWDEITMAHKGGVEAINKTLQDIRENKNLMGGVTVLLAGDFRQTLPVVPRGTRADEIKACLKRSILWPAVEILKLTKNMRVHLGGYESAAKFSDLLLKIGNGEIPSKDGMMIIPDELCLLVSTVQELIDSIYPDIMNIQDKLVEWFCERAILTPKNDQATYINDMLLRSINEEEKVYKSIDSVCNADDAVNYPVEFLNSLKPSGLPYHRIILKKGTPIMLLRNLKPPKLCNGTRLQVKTLHTNLIEAIILTGCAQGETVFVPRIPLIPSDLPFEFKRLQFPIKLCFAMTINKSQGQTLKFAGVDLRENCFSHGQFYVACSRVSSNTRLVILSQPHKQTKNIVYKEIL